MQVPLFRVEFAVYPHHNSCFYASLTPLAFINSNSRQSCELRLLIVLGVREGMDISFLAVFPLHTLVV